MGGWRVLGNEEEVLIVHTLADVSNEAAAADAAFIAEARTALPAALDVIEAQRGLLEEARTALEAFNSSITFGGDWGAWFRSPSKAFPKALSEPALKELLAAVLSRLPKGA
jgi:hypothetical protein